MPTYLTPHFTLEELTYTNTGLDNTITKGSVAYSKLKAMARLLEYIRNVVGFPLYINSCYRSPIVNARVGGSRTSFHLYGCAADISVYHLKDYERDSLERAINFYKPCEFIKYDTFWHVAFDISTLGTGDKPVSTWEKDYPELAEAPAISGDF